MGLLCCIMYESNTALCTYWIPEIVEPTSSNRVKKGFQEIQVCNSLTIYALMNAESRYCPQSSLYEDSIYIFPHIDWYFSKKLEKLPIKSLTRSTQRAQTSLAEADHYSHILPTVKMLSLGCERLPPPPPPPAKKKKKGSGSLPAPRSGYATTITVFFCSFTHLTIPRSPPKFNQFFLVLLWTPP